MAEQKKKRKRLSKRAINVLLAFGFMLSTGLACYPSFMNSYYNINQTTQIGGYESEAKNVHEPRLTAYKKAALAYNEKISTSHRYGEFYYTGYETMDPEYEGTLKISEYSRVMAYIDIPKIDVYLPIVHGCSERDLRYQIGHMYGTSLPIGGPNSHCVVAGHTGLEDIDLFTYLTRLRRGDQFYIHVIDEIHVYTVVDTHVVWPTEESPYLQIEPGRDLLTMYTCTPYGVNDHRLLVCGERTYPDLHEPLAKGTAVSTTTVRKENIYKCVFWASLPVVVLIIGLILALKKPKKKKKKKKRGKKGKRKKKKK